jgi:hypothetical protein
MPRTNKDLKRLVRTRMQKTGEAYTTARARLLDKKKAPPQPKPDYAKLAGQTDEVMLNRTGRSWQQWVEVLDAEQAHKLPHREIARLVSDKYKVADWWTQTVTVGYERIKGLREIGQRRDGLYEANKSKTFNVDVETLFDLCADAKLRKKWLTDEDVTMRSSKRPNAVRLVFPDDTVALLGLMSKGEQKSSLAIQHTKLADRAAIERAKAEWANRLNALAAFLAKWE